MLVLSLHGVQMPCTLRGSLKTKNQYSSTQSTNSMLILQWSNSVSTIQNKPHVHNLAAQNHNGSEAICTVALVFAVWLQCSHCGFCISAMV